jgi:hypothetical protein
MGRSGLPTTLVICCQLPQGMPNSTAEACLDFGRRSAVPVTWLATIDRLPLVAGQRGTTPSLLDVALEIPAHQPRQELRQLLARAAEEVPGLDAAVIRGPLPAEHRQVLIDSGIRVVCRDRFDDTNRGSRRPAPHGWPCRSTLWGLWEVTQSGTVTPPGMVNRLIPWGSPSGPAPGSLTLIDIGGQGHAGADVIRSRIEQWHAWAQRRSTHWQTVFASLSDLPTLIAGAARLPEGGSVLKAA